MRPLPALHILPSFSLVAAQGIQLPEIALCLPSGNITMLPVPGRKLLARLHRDERGAVSLETILIIGAIALPVLIYLIKYGWPRIRDYFYKGIETLENESDNATNNGP